MTNPDLKAIQERAEKATEPPLEGSSWLITETTDDGFCISGVAYLMGTNAEANADFIAHAREDIPMLLKALAEVRKEAQQLRNWAKDFPNQRVWTHIVINACDAILGGSE